MLPRRMFPCAPDGVARVVHAKFTIPVTRSRRAVIVLGRQHGFGGESLEHAIQVINKFIFEHEERRKRQRARRGEMKGGAEVEVQPISKPITFKASAKTEKLVKEPPGSSSFSRSLSAYLALPLDQYSLLDPSWISRSPSAPDVFVLRVPLFDLVGLELQPQITVRVSLDPRNGQVHFHADQFKVGDPRFDSDFKLAMKATLMNKPVPTIRPLRSIKRMWARAGGSGGNGGGGEESASSRSGTSAAPQVPIHGSSIDGGESPAGSGNEEGEAVIQDTNPDSDISGGRTSCSSSTNMSNTSTNARAGGSEQSNSRTATHSCSSSRAYETAGVVDNGLGASIPRSGTHAAIPPHVTVVPDEKVEVTGMGPASAVALGAAGMGSTNAAVVFGNQDEDVNHSSSSSSSCSSSNGSNLDRQRTVGTSPTSGCNGGSTSATSNIHNGGTRHGEGGEDDDGDPPPIWPAASYGVAHPAVSTAAVARVAGSVNTVPSTVLATAIPSPSVSSSNLSATVPRPPPAPVRKPEEAIVVPTGPPSVPAAVAQQAATSLTDPSSLPFIEDSRLYVPASQWGRTPCGQLGEGAASRTASIVSATSTAAAGGRMSTSATLRTTRGDSGAIETDAATAAGSGPGSAALHITATIGGGFGGAEVTDTGGGRDTNRSSAPALVARGRAPEAVTAELVSTAPSGPGKGGDVNGAQEWRGEKSADISSGSRSTGISATSSIPGSSSSSINGDDVFHGSQLLVAARGTVGAAGLSTDIATPHASWVSGASTMAGVSGSSSTQQGTATADGQSSLFGRDDVENSVRSHDDGGSLEGSERMAAPAALPPSTTKEASAQPPLPPLPPPPHQDGGAATPLKAASSITADEGATALLVGSVDVAVTVMLPPAFSAVPRPLLGMTGSLIARYAISSLLPSFLDLLVADYGRWSSGQTVTARAAPAGDLVAVAAANAAAMGATVTGPRAQQK